MLEMDRIVRPQVINLVPVILQACTHMKKQNPSLLLIRFHGHGIAVVKVFCNEDLLLLALICYCY